MNYIEYMQQPAATSSTPSPKQILKDGGNFLKHFPLKEIYRYRRLTPDNYQAPKIFKS
jgi:hypothetical protein